MVQDEDERPDLKGAYTISISTNPKETRDSLQVPKNVSRGRSNRRPITYKPREKIMSETPTRSSYSPYFIHPISPVNECPTDTDSSVLEGFRALSLDSSALETSADGMGCGITSGKKLEFLSILKSSQIPRPTPKRQAAPSTVTGTPVQHQKEFTPSKPPQIRFLNRFTNDLAPVFDTENRIEAMEREFTAFKQKMEGETTQATDLKDTIKMLQSRGM